MRDQDVDFTIGRGSLTWTLRLETNYQILAANINVKPIISARLDRISRRWRKGKADVFWADRAPQDARQGHGHCCCGRAHDVRRAFRGRICLDLLQSSGPSVQVVARSIGRAHL